MGYRWPAGSTLAAEGLHRAGLVHDALLEIARLDPQTRIGIVCVQPTTQQYLASAVGMIHHGEIRACLLSEKQRLREMYRAIDLVVDAPSCHRAVVRRFPSLPNVTVGFRIDAKSLSPLRDRLARLLSEDQPGQ